MSAIYGTGHLSAASICIAPPGASNNTEHSMERSMERSMEHSMGPHLTLSRLAPLSTMSTQFRPTSVQDVVSMFFNSRKNSCRKDVGVSEGFEAPHRSRTPIFMYVD